MKKMFALFGVLMAVCVLFCSNLTVFACEENDKKEVLRLETITVDGVDYNVFLTDDVGREEVAEEIERLSPKTRETLVSTNVTGSKNFYIAIPSRLNNVSTTYYYSATGASTKKVEWYIFSDLNWSSQLYYGFCFANGIESSKTMSLSSGLHSMTVTGPSTQISFYMAVN